MRCCCFWTQRCLKWEQRSDSLPLKSMRLKHTYLERGIERQSTCPSGFVPHVPGSPMPEWAEMVQIGWYENTWSCQRRAWTTNILWLAISITMNVHPCTKRARYMDASCTTTNMLKCALLMFACSCVHSIDECVLLRFLRNVYSNINGRCVLC